MEDKDPSLAFDEILDRDRIVRKILDQVDISELDLETLRARAILIDMEK